MPPVKEQNEIQHPIYNIDCIQGAKEHLEDASVDLIVSDPPFGINEGSFGSQYSRDETKVIEGYQEAPDDYAEFTDQWIGQAHRILKENGSMYIVSGWTKLNDILTALESYNFTVINHIIWKYQFGVNTTKKYVSSHYHILYVSKKNAKPTFKPYARFGFDEVDEAGRKLRYQDMEDVWFINKENQPGQMKNKNKLPDALVDKMILYSSNVGDTVCDFFMGNFTTAYRSLTLGRKVSGFELNENAFHHHMPLLGNVEETIPVDKDSGIPANQGKPITETERENILSDFIGWKGFMSKKNTMTVLERKYGRGYWGIDRVVKLLPKDKAPNADNVKINTLFLRK
jgi:site-specific DNA-methyltransferase (adenine-specific)